MHHAARSAGLRTDPSDVSSEEKLASVCRIAQEKLNHGGAKDVSSVRKPKPKRWIDSQDLMKGNRPE